MTVGRSLTGFLVHRDTTGLGLLFRTFRRNTIKLWMRSGRDTTSRESAAIFSVPSSFGAAASSRFYWFGTFLERRVGVRPALHLQVARTPHRDRRTIQILFKLAFTRPLGTSSEAEPQDHFSLLHF